MKLQCALACLALALVSCTTVRTENGYKVYTDMYAKKLNDTVKVMSFPADTKSILEKLKVDIYSLKPGKGFHKNNYVVQEFFLSDNYKLQIYHQCLDSNNQHELQDQVLLDLRIYSGTIPILHEQSIPGDKIVEPAVVDN